MKRKKTWLEKEKMLVTSIFSLTHNVLRFDTSDKKTKIALTVLL